MIVDADAHVIEPWEMWQERMAPALRERAPRRARDRWDTDRLSVESRLYPTPEGPGRGPRKIMDEPEATRYRDDVAVSRQPGMRLRRMDEENVDAAVILPSQALVIGAVSDPVLATAIADAYNGWVWDYCRAAPERLIPAAILPPQDVARAVGVLRRAHEMGFSVLVMRPNPVGGRTLDDRAYDPMWQEIEDRGLAVLVHEGTGFSPGETAGIDRYEHGICTHLVSHPLEQMLAVTSVIFGGLLARFPGLRLGFLEAGCGWLPYWLDRMDAHFEAMAWEVPRLSMRPSEYFRRQCFVSCEADDPFIPAVVESLGSGVLIFSTDFPHSDHTMRGAVPSMRGRSDIPADALDAILGGNCRRLLARDGTR